MDGIRGSCRRSNEEHDVEAKVACPLSLYPKGKTGISRGDGESLGLGGREEVERK